MSINYYYERIKYNLQEPARFVISTSPRKILLAVNFVIAVFSLGLAGFSIYLSYLLYDSRFLSGWVDWLGLSLVGICLAAICSVGMRGAHVLSLELLLSYFWGITVFIAPLLLGTVASFDFYVYIHSWFVHQWSEPGFVRVRELFCQPSNTVSTTCAPPILGLDGSIDAWCMYYYNSTDCYNIRETAIHDAVEYGRALTLVQGSICIIVLLLIGLSMYICQRIITAPVITQSMNDVINYLLLLPIAGSVGIASYLWWIRNYEIQYSWIAEFFAALGATVLICIPFGIISGRLKSRFLLTCYLVLTSSTCAGYALAGALGLLTGQVILADFKPTTEVASNIACQIHLSGCSLCSNTYGNRCPEWSKNDIIQQVVSDLHIAGAVAFISMLYLVGSIIVASIVHKSLENYKTEYV